MNPTIPPTIAPIPPTRTTSAPPVNVTTPPGAAAVPVAGGGAEPVAFLAVLVNAGVEPVGAGEVDAVMVGTAEVGTRAAEVALAVPAGTVLLAWKPAESVMPKLAAQSEGESPCWGVSWEWGGPWRCE